VVTSTTHKTLRGPRGGLILSRAELAERLNREIFPGIQGGPLMHVIAAKAVAFKEALSEDFKRYQQSIVRNARVMAEGLMQAGLRLITGGTDNHMLLVDLRNLDITGKAAEDALGQAGITANKNSIPFDERGPAVTSGIRLGTPVLTTRGMGPPEMTAIAAFIARVLKAPGDAALIRDVRREVEALCRRFPLYPDCTAANGPQTKERHDDR
jgi:glycine hydroxymethyltransferase